MIGEKNLNITLTALRDALRGVDSKTISDLATLLTAIKDTAGIKKIVDTVNVALTSSNTTDVVFHDAATVPANGTVFTVGGYKTLTVEIYGTSTSRTIEFKARGPAGVDRALMGVRLSDLATAISTTGTGEIWQFDITGLTSVFMNLSAVAGGNVSVKGKVVA